MKILHLGLCCNPNFWNGFQQAFVTVIGKYNYSEVYTGDANFNTKARQLFDKHKPDIVFMQIQSEGVADYSLLDYMKNQGACVINWTGDKRSDIPRWMIDAAPFVSITAFSNMHDVRNMRKLGYNSEFLEIGYDETIYTPTGDRYNVPDIIFMGNNYGSGFFPMSDFRISLVTALKKSFGDRFGVYGSGWGSIASGNVNHSQPEEAKHYRGCKIAINCSHFNVERYNSDRILRILGTGTFCLSAKHEAMEQDYVGGEHLVYFNTIDEMVFKINKYLSEEEERKRIAENGQKLVLNRNTFVHQVKEIIKLAE